MKLIKPFLMITTVIFFSGCSSSAPSDIEAKVVVQSMFEGCQYLALDSFKKINGIPQGENEYQVEVSYSVKVTPVPENVRKIGLIAARIAELNALIDVANNDFTEVMSKIQQFRPGTKEHAELYSQQWDARRLEDETRRERRELITATVNPIKEFSQACPNVSLQTYAEFFEGDDINQYVKTFTKEFTASISMINTDNGWVYSN